MIYHSVLFKLKPETTREDKDAMIQHLNSLGKEITGINFLNVNYNLSDRSQGHEIALISSFDNKHLMQAYIDHPFHQEALAKYVKPHLEQVIVGDIEV